MKSSTELLMSKKKKKTYPANKNLVSFGIYVGFKGTRAVTMAAFWPVRA